MGIIIIMVTKAVSKILQYKDVDILKPAGHLQNAVQALQRKFLEIRKRRVKSHFDELCGTLRGLWVVRAISYN